MRALITGAAGFIGSHLCDRLVAEDWDVTGIDNCSTGTTKNLAQVLAHKDRHLTFIMGNVSKILRGWPAVDYDVVFHLAARIGPEYVVKDRLAMLAEHAQDTLAVIRLCRKSGARLVFTSTSEVYGANTKEPFEIDDTMTIGPTQHPRWAYAVSKLACEHAIMGAVEKFGISAVIARLFNVVGPRQSAQHGLVLPTFASRALQAKPLTIHGDGTQRRCFSHVRDVVATLYRLAGEATDRIVNVGSGETRMIQEVAAAVVEHVAETYGVISHVEHVGWNEVPDRPSTMRLRVPGSPELDGTETEVEGHPVLVLGSTDGLGDGVRGGRIWNRAHTWPEIVRDVCAWHAEQLGVVKVEVAA